MLYENPQIILSVRCYIEHITILYKIQNITIIVQTTQIIKQSQLLKK